MLYLYSCRTYANDSSHAVCCKFIPAGMLSAVNGNSLNCVPAQPTVWAVLRGSAALGLLLWMRSSDERWRALVLPAEATRLDWVRLDSIDQIKINSFGIDYGNAESWVRKPGTHIYHLGQYIRVLEKPAPSHNISAVTSRSLWQSGLNRGNFLSLFTLTVYTTLVAVLFLMVLLTSITSPTGWLIRPQQCRRL